MSKLRDLTGQIFDQLTVECISGKRTSDNRILWRCICKCGNYTNVRATSLLRGDTKSCGCIRSKKSGERTYKHGQTGTKEYQAWQAMHRRCEYKEDHTNQNYIDYYLRGIRVCKRYGVFTNFFEDLGFRPPDKDSIGRIDNDGNYSCGKCSECIEKGWEMNLEWQTAKEQALNRRSNVLLTYKGKTQTLSQWSGDLGIKRTTISERLKKGWSIEEAFVHPKSKKIQSNLDSNPRSQT